MPRQRKRLSKPLRSVGGPHRQKKKAWHRGETKLHWHHHQPGELKMRRPQRRDTAIRTGGSCLRYGLSRLGIVESTRVKRRILMRLFLATIGATAIAAVALMTPPAHARFDKTIAVPNQVEAVACRVVRTRVVRPSGRVVFRTRRVCRPAMGPRCRVVKHRTVRPNGSVVVRTVRRCC